MKLLSRSGIVVIIFLLPWHVFAWSPLGHMVIANIAYQRLTPSARDKVDDLVAQLNEEYPTMDTFPKMAYWADAIRIQKIETFTHWHYIDLPISTDKSQLKHVADTDNAVWAVNRIELVVKNNKANPYERARFLAFLAHIVGDIHQPLHTVSNITVGHPDGDQGGNLTFVYYDGVRIKLHRLWDQGVNVFAGDRSDSHLSAITTAITEHYPEAYFGNKADDLDPNHWAQEGKNMATQFVYATPENQAVSEKYIETGKQLSEQQAALAGYRLAHLLNVLLGDHAERGLDKHKSVKYT